MKIRLLPKKCRFCGSRKRLHHFHKRWKDVCLGCHEATMDWIREIGGVLTVPAKKESHNV